MNPAIRSLIPHSDVKYLATFFDPSRPRGYMSLPILSFGVVNWGGEACDIRSFVVRDGLITEAEEALDFCGLIREDELGAIHFSQTMNGRVVLSRVAYFRDHPEALEEADAQG